MQGPVMIEVTVAMIVEWNNWDAEMNEREHWIGSSDTSGWPPPSLLVDFTFYQDLQFRNREL